MSIDVVMPQMGESVAEGTIIKWMVKIGDTVGKDDPLFEISTDKVDAEVPSPAAGTILEILVLEGETIEVGVKVAVIGGEIGAASATPEAPPAQDVQESPAAPAATTDAVPTPATPAAPAGGGTPVLMPQMGESVAEGTVIKWMVHEGDTVGKDDPLFEISTDKVDAEVPSPAAGVITRILVQEGETVEVGVQVAELAMEGAPAPATVPAPAPPAAPAAPPVAAPAPVPVASAAATAVATAPPRTNVRSSPVARRIASEHNLDIGMIAGTGRGGRVSKKDVLAAVAGGTAQQVAAAVTASPTAPAPSTPQSTAPVVIPAGMSDPGGMGIGVQPEIEYPIGADAVIQPMTKMRRIISEHMIASRRTSAHVGAVFEIDFSVIMNLRKKWKADFRARHGANLSVTTCVIYALIPALRTWPIVNASIVNGDQIEYHKHVNVGVAVALPDGLIVPVIRDAEQKGIGEIAREIADLSGRARGKKLLPDEVSGSTFTLTNPGIFGAVFGIPIINQPNVAILGMGGVTKRVVVTSDDSIAIRPIANFCMSYDHRLIDGAVADQFLADLKQRIENFPEEVLA